MSPFFEFKFPPAMIEETLSAAPTLLRNWRMRGHLDHIGEAQGGGRWLYNGSDLTKMALVLIMQKDQVDLDDAFHFAEKVETGVLNELYDLEYDGIAARFTSFFRNHETGDWIAYHVHDFAHLDINAPITTFLDARAIASIIPDKLKNILPPPTTDDLHEVDSRSLSRSVRMKMDKATSKMEKPEDGNL